MKKKFHFIPKGESLTLCGRDDYDQDEDFYGKENEFLNYQHPKALCQKCLHSLKLRNENSNSKAKDGQIKEGGSKMRYYVFVSGQNTDDIKDFPSKELAEREIEAILEDDELAIEDILIVYGNALSFETTRKVKSYIEKLID